MHRRKRASPLAHSNRRASRVFPFRTCARKRRMWVSRDLSVSARWLIFSIPDYRSWIAPVIGQYIFRALLTDQLLRLIAETHNCHRMCLPNWRFTSIPRCKKSSARRPHSGAIKIYGISSGYLAEKLLERENNLSILIRGTYQENIFKIYFY